MNSRNVRVVALALAGLFAALRAGFRVVLLLGALLESRKTRHVI